jgi:uncharacterized membrane protein
VADGQSDQDPWWRRAWERVPASAYFGSMLLLIALLVLSRPLSPGLLYGRFVEPYLWGPIVRDEGFNAVSTVALLVVAAILLLWFLRLLKSYREHIDMELAVAILPFFVWGAMLRVLEDSDLFAPFAEDIARLDPSLPARTSCLPALGGPFLENCFGVLLITPIIWIEACLLIYVLGRLGLFARQAGERWGPRGALGVYGLTLIVGVLLVELLLVASPHTVRVHPPLWVLLASAGLAFAIVALQVRREGNVGWRRALFASSTAIMAVCAYYVVLWLAGGSGSWRPSADLRPGVLIGLAVAMALVAYSISFKARVSASGSAREGRASRPLTLLVYLVLLEAAAIFVSAAAPAEGVDGRRLLTAALVGPLAVLAGNALTRFAAPRVGGDPAMSILARPLNLLVVVAQAADAFMTAVSIDLFGAGEKHFVPRTLIGYVNDLDLPSPLGEHPAALVMVLYKVPLSILLVWTLDRHIGATPVQRDASALLKLGAIAVGLAPAVRDALRLVMGV